MQRSSTQFTVAIIALFFLGAATLVAVIGDVFFDKPSDFGLLPVGSLTTATGQAIAYLFRINGQSGSQ